MRRLLLTGPHARNEQRVSSPRFWLSFRVFTDTDHGIFGSVLPRRQNRSFRGFAPFSVFPTLESDLIRCVPPHRYVCVLGIVSSPRRLAPPKVYRAYFIPLPLLGFYPSRSCSLPSAVRSFERLCLLDVVRRPSARPCSFGKSRPHARGLERPCCDYLLGVCSSEAFPQLTLYSSLSLPSPHALLPCELLAPRLAFASGCFSCVAASFSLETVVPL